MVEKCVVFAAKNMSSPHCVGYCGVKIMHIAQKTLGETFKNVKDNKVHVD